MCSVCHLRNHQVLWGVYDSESDNFYDCQSRRGVLIVSVLQPLTLFYNNPAHSGIVLQG